MNHCVGGEPGLENVNEITFNHFDDCSLDFFTGTVMLDLYHERRSSNDR